MHRMTTPLRSSRILQKQRHLLFASRRTQRTWDTSKILNKPSLIAHKTLSFYATKTMCGNPPKLQMFWPFSRQNPMSEWCCTTSPTSMAKVSPTYRHRNNMAHRSCWPRNCQKTCDVTRSSHFCCPSQEHGAAACRLLKENSRTFCFPYLREKAMTTGF